MEHTIRFCRGQNCDIHLDDTDLTQGIMVVVMPCTMSRIGTRRLKSLLLLVEVVACSGMTRSAVAQQPKEPTTNGGAVQTEMRNVVYQPDSHPTAAQLLDDAVVRDGLADHGIGAMLGAV